MKEPANLRDPPGLQNINLATYTLTHKEYMEFKHKDWKWLAEGYRLANERADKAETIAEAILSHAKIVMSKEDYYALVRRVMALRSGNPLPIDGGFGGRTTGIIIPENPME